MCCPEWHQESVLVRPSHVTTAGGSEIDAVMSCRNAHLRRENELGLPAEKAD